MSNYIGEVILVGFNFAPDGWAFCNGQLLPIAQYDALFTLIGTTYGGNGTTTFALPDLRGRVPIHMGQGSGLASYVAGQNGGAETVNLTATQMPAHNHAIDTSALTITARCKNGIANQASPQNAVPAAESWVTTFTDGTLTAGSSTVKALHVIELRSRIDALRGKYGLTAFSYTDPALAANSTMVKAAHIMELRSALAAAYSAGGFPAAAPYTDPVITTSTPFKTAHITELRANVTALGSVSALPYSTSAPDASMGSGGVTLSGTATAAVTGGSQAHNNMQPYLGLNYCISLFGVFPSQT
jgi:microcystin-dependent protein